ncbi:MAG: cyclic nucleotide-binding domain-containing protein [Anaerolineae bacterium]|nr:cyclic nucleotide-binding domain-containing protein [Anaerolineae bacterium]
MDDLIKLLRSVELFAGLNDEQLKKVATIFKEHSYKKGEIVFSQGDKGDHLYLVQEGFVEVIAGEGQGQAGGRTLVNLGPGQSVGEMALVDQGPRSATVRAVGDKTVIGAVSRAAFEQLCENDTAIGYRVMRNIAIDISFKLRHQTLSRP